MQAEITVAQHLAHRVTQLKKAVVSSSFGLLRSFDRVRASQHIKDQAEFAKRAYEHSLEHIKQELQVIFSEVSVVTPYELGDESKKRQIYVDGLVGWNNFRCGRYGWGVLVGAYFDGVCEAAVLYEPISMETYSAALQQGAFLNGHRLRITNIPKTCPDLPYTLSCRSLSLGYVAAGKIDSITIAKTSPASWEPAKLFVTEARGSVVEDEDTVVARCVELPTQ